MNLTRCVVFSLLLLNLPAAASDRPQHLGTSAQQSKAYEWNRLHSKLHANGNAFALPDLSSPPSNWKVVRPFSEIEHTGYVALSGVDMFELADLRAAVAKNLPSDATLILYVDDDSMIPDLQSAYGASLENRLKFLIVPHGDDEIWARDSLPFPVVMQSGNGLVGSIYPQNFDPDASFAKAFSLPMASTGVYFRGGNLLFDLHGNCFAERASEVEALGDDEAIRMFKEFFGCKTATILDYAGAGIGDLDERMKFLADGSAATDWDDYAKILQQRGYKVHRIPRTGSDMETYMNTLVVNGTIFVPQMHAANDQAALDAWRAVGLKPVGVYTQSMADEGNGNIHCVSMNYPPGAFKTNAKDPRLVDFAN